jgi:hypothetical protein
MSDSTDDQPKRRPGRPKGLPKTGGRVKGVPPKVTTETKANIAEFLTNLTTGNLRWRQRVARILDGNTMPQDFLAWSKVAFDRSLGLPAKYQAPKPEKEPFLFINYRHGDDPMRQKTDLMIEAKAQEERLLAIEEGRVDPEEILRARAAAEAKKDDPPGEELEAVVPPPEPYEFPKPVRERDRAPRGER